MTQRADVLLLLEGTYPYVQGGVSAWVYQFIQALSHVKFAIVFLGSTPGDYNEEPVYPILENIVHFEKHYLFDGTEDKVDVEKRNGNRKVLSVLRELHHAFLKNIELPRDLVTPQFFLDKKKGMTFEDFLHSRVAWDFLVDQYERNADDQPFIEYFWAIRNMHQPMWRLANIAANLPEASLAHSVSTGYAGFLGKLAAQQFEVPLLISEHGIYTKERRIDLLHKEWALEKNEHLQKVWIRFFEVLGRFAYDQASDVVALFKGYQELQIRYGAPPEKTVVIPNGIDIEAGKAMLKQRPDTAAPVICFLGRVVPIKDVKTFIRAINIVCETIPTVQAWIVGPENEQKEYAEECRELVDLLDRSDQILFKGPQNITDIFPHIKLMALTSISEGLPLVMLESFAAGVPVVASDVGACRELIEGVGEEDQALGQAGRVVGIGDPASSAAAMLELLENDDSWAQAQKAGLTRVERYYEKNDIWQQYQDLYKKHGVINN